MRRSWVRIPPPALLMSEPTPQPLESLASSVEKMIRQIAQSLPEGVATLEVKRGSSCNAPVGRGRAWIRNGRVTGGRRSLEARVHEPAASFEEALLRVRAVRLTPGLTSCDSAGTRARGRS